MRYADIDKCDLCNGKNIGMSLYIQGCNAHCYNCFNPETWDFNGGKEWNKEIEKQFFQLAERPYIKRISFLGGEPLTPKNIETVSSLIVGLKQKYPEKQIWIYTGYLLNDLITFIFSNNENEQKALDIALDNSDYIVDGKYIDSLKDPSLAFRGSANQIIWQKRNGRWISITEKGDKI